MPLNDLPGEQKTPDKPIEHLSGLAHALSQQAVHNPPANLLRAVDAGGEGAGFLLLAPSVSTRLWAPPAVSAPALPQGTIQGFQRIGGQPVVRVHKGQIGSPGLSHAQVPGRAHPAVLLVENPYPAVLPGNLVAERAASVWGAIVDQQDLQLPHRLCQDGFCALTQKCLGTINGYNHRNFRHTRPSFSVISFRRHLGAGPAGHGIHAGRTPRACSGFVTGRRPSAALPGRFSPTGPPGPPGPCGHRRPAAGKWAFGAPDPG